MKSMQSWTATLLIGNPSTSTHSIDAIDCIMRHCDMSDDSNDAIFRTVCNRRRLCTG